MKRIKQFIPILIIQLFLLPLLIFWQTSFNTIILTSSLVLMISLWAQEDIPLWIPSLIPLVILGPLGFLSYSKIISHYFSPIIFLFFGGMVLAKLIEHHKLHLLVFHKLIVHFEKTRFLILLGVLFISIILSSFISNTAAALLMLPLIVQLKSPSLLLAMGYGVSLGGLATLTSSPPNAIMANFWNTTVVASELSKPITYLSWIKYTYPLILLGTLVLFIVISMSLLTEKNIHIEHQKIEQSKLNYFQLTSILIFLVFIFGWMGSAYFSFLPTEANFSLIMAFLILIYPIKKNEQRLFPVHLIKELNYGVLLLFGAGLAFADAISSSEIISLIKNNSSAIAFLSLEVKLFLVTLVMILFTEISSNTAAAAIFIPIIYALHKPLGLPALPTIMAVTAASSLSFMLPSATPPNAIVFSSKLIKLNFMLKLGFILNLIFAFLITYWSLRFVA